MDELVTNTIRDFDDTTTEALRGLRDFLGVVEALPIPTTLNEDDRRVIESVSATLAGVATVCADLGKSFGRLLEAPAREN